MSTPEDKELQETWERLGGAVCAECHKMMAGQDPYILMDIFNKVGKWCSAQCGHVSSISSARRSQHCYIVRIKNGAPVAQLARLCELKCHGVRVGWWIAWPLDR